MHGCRHSSEGDQTSQYVTTKPNTYARHFEELRSGGLQVLARKLRTTARQLPRFLRLLPWLPIVALIRALRPIVLIRLQPLISSSLGHLAFNTETYLCERDAGIDVPKEKHLDLCFFAQRVLANRYLASMWRRVLPIFPYWVLGPASELNELLPGGSAHVAGLRHRHSRDAHNVLERFPPHLSFNAKEEERGRAGLRALGIPDGARFVCFVLRDSAYLEAVRPNANFDYHAYRNVSVANFRDAARALANRGYHVLRMGSIVREPIETSHPMIVDYATSEHRSDFLDIYLSAKCEFCLTVGSGIDNVAIVFRRPIAYVDLVPICNYVTYLKDSLFLAKLHRSSEENRFLTLSETFRSGAAFCLTSECFAQCGVELVENTPQEVTAVAIEMAERVEGSWIPASQDDALQARFWSLYPLATHEVSEGHPLHGRVRARHAAVFLRQNEWWLE
jgi:putative glycosyltransferase (TIGR04372 family)